MDASKYPDSGGVLYKAFSSLASEAFASSLIILLFVKLVINYGIQSCVMKCPFVQVSFLRTGILTSRNRKSKGVTT